MNTVKVLQQNILELKKSYIKTSYILNFYHQTYCYYCCVIVRYILFSLFFFSFFKSFAQQDVLNDWQIDSLMIAEDSITALKEDSLRIEQEKLKLMNEMQQADSFISFTSNLQLWLSKKFSIEYDVQQRREKENNSNLFIGLLLMLIVVTYLKLAFANDLEELWQSVSNANRAVQIFRTQTDTITVSSFLLSANFVLSSVLFIQLALQKFSPSLAVESRTTTFYLIILFTSFLLLRTLLLRIIGFVFSISDVTSMYEFNFVRIAQTLGLAMLPAVLLLYASDKKFFSIIIAVVCLVCCVAFVLLVMRGLSTSAKVIFNNVKYFFIYVCVGEVTLVFFFSKLLTKIVS
jgi:hypothetical protein